MKSSKIGYLTHEGFKSITTHGFMSFATVTIVVACLVIMGSFSLIAVNLSSMLDTLESNNEIVAYVEQTLSEDEARALQENIEYIQNVSEAVYVTREEAMAEFTAQYDDSLFADLDASTFRDRYVVYLSDISLMEQTKADLESITGIAKVQAYLKVAEGFVTVRNVMSAVSLIIVVILVIVSVFIMANTIKLASYSRREEIAIMKIIGASNAFIRFPFIVEGLVLGVLGGALGFLLEWGIYDIVANRIMAGMLGGLIEVIPFDSVKLVVLAIYLGVGVVVGAFGSSIAIRNYLRV